MGATQGAAIRDCDSQAQFASAIGDKASLLSQTKRRQALLEILARKPGPIGDEVPEELEAA